VRIKGEPEGSGGEIELTLTEPITAGQLAKISDAEYEHTDRIWIVTPSLKHIEFVKMRTAKKVAYFHGEGSALGILSYSCEACGYHVKEHDAYCAGCGARFV